MTVSTIAAAVPALSPRLRADAVDVEAAGASAVWEDAEDVVVGDEIVAVGAVARVASGVVLGAHVKVGSLHSASVSATACLKL